MTAPERVRPRFFLGISVVLLVVVFLGFAPTFYLDPLFDVPTRATALTYPDSQPMPLYLIVHGAFLTAWYAGLVVQSGLIVRGRRDVHRRLGLAGVAVAAGVVISGAMATLALIPRATGEQVAVTSNSLNLALFVGLVAVAVYKRARPPVHKRLMLIASIAIIGPAVSPDRMLGGFLASLVSSFIAVPPPLIFWVFLIGALVVHDLLGSGRLHPATVWGGGAKAAAAVLTIALASSGGAAAYVNWLERSAWLVTVGR